MPAPTCPAPPRQPKTTPAATAGHDDRLRYATAAGAEDGCCHWYISLSRTLCGQRRTPPLEPRELHRAAPCPNGNPPCPQCVQIATERGQGR